jgi:hypothetical protein
VIPETLVSQKEAYPPRTHVAMANWIEIEDGEWINTDLMPRGRSRECRSRQASKATDANIGHPAIRGLLSKCRMCLNAFAEALVRKDAGASPSGCVFCGASLACPVLLSSWPSQLLVDEGG